MICILQTAFPTIILHFQFSIKYKTLLRKFSIPVTVELSVFYFKRHFNCPILGILYKIFFHFSTLLLFTNAEKCSIIYLIVERQSCPLLLDEAPYLSKLCLRAFLIFIFASSFLLEVFKYQKKPQSNNSVAFSLYIRILLLQHPDTFRQ